MTRFLLAFSLALAVLSPRAEAYSFTAFDPTWYGCAVKLARYVLDGTKSKDLAVDGYVTWSYAAPGRLPADWYYLTAKDKAGQNYEIALLAFYESRQERCTLVWRDNTAAFQLKNPKGEVIFQDGLRDNHGHRFDIGH